MSNKIGKIVELLIDWDNLEFDDLGVDIMSLVDKPAIGIKWQAFAAQQFVDPKAGESEADYVSRCIPVLIEEGFDDEQAAAICYNSYAGEEFLEDNPCQSGYVAYGTKNKGGRQVPNCIPVENSEQAEEVDPIIELASQVDFGETLDYANTFEIDLAQANFNDFSDTLKAIIGLDIIGKKDPKEEGETKYRYAGPTGQREFCRAMLRVNKVYTLQEVERMAGLNPGFGPRGASTYDIFKYKGGPNCQHYWEQVRVFRDGRRTVVVSEGKATGLAGEAPEQMPNNGYLMSKWNFSDDDQMIITGPAMTPNTLIPRKDEDGNLFHVYFTEETIKKISKKFFEYNKLHNTDINHDNSVTTDNTLLESWIVEDPEMDKSTSLGFNVPPSTWMVSYKINNKETWQKIKDGELNGFSIAGNFIERATKK